MILEQDEMRGRIERVRVVRMATVDDRGRAHVVPVIFAVDGDIFYSPTDKPKDGDPRPKRLRNLDRDQRVTVLADVYDDDWLNAWWVRLRGTARVVGEGPERTHALGLIDPEVPDVRRPPLPYRRRPGAGGRDQGLARLGVQRPISGGPRAAAAARPAVAALAVTGLVAFGHQRLCMQATRLRAWTFR